MVSSVEFSLSFSLGFSLELFCWNFLPLLGWILMRTTSGGGGKYYTCVNLLRKNLKISHYVFRLGFQIYLHKILQITPWTRLIFFTKFCTTERARFGRCSVRY